MPAARPALDFPAMTSKLLFLFKLIQIVILDMQLTTLIITHSCIVEFMRYFFLYVTGKYYLIST